MRNRIKAPMDIYIIWCLFLLTFMMTLIGDAVHVEIEELTEQQPSYIVTTETYSRRSKKILTTTQVHPDRTLDVQGDPGTESACKFAGECGLPGYKPCPIGSSCENIPGIDIGWCCQNEPQTGSETAMYQTSNYTKSQQQVTQNQNSKPIRKLYQPFNKIPRAPTPTKSQSEKINVPTKRITENPTSNLRNRCNGTPVGKCGGPLMKNCPQHSKCSFVNKSTGDGVCCRTRPSCLYGYTGTCGKALGRQCETGSKCKYLHGSNIGWCCSTRADIGTCPNGQDGICGPSSKLTCRSGTSCRFLRKGVRDAVGKCCIDNPKEAFCPSGDVGKACSSLEPCNNDSECRYGFCCRNKSCPSAWVNEGTCNINPGAPVCPRGSKCIKGSCCRLPRAVCPSGVFQSTCSKTKGCNVGYVCRFGNCCRI